MQRERFLAVSLAAIATVSFARASALMRVAIVAAADTDIAPQDLDRFVARLGHGLLTHPQCQLLSRARLDAILQEQGFSNSAYADPATAAKLGKIIGASHILHATLTIETEESSGLMDHERVNVTSDYELIEVSTARIMANGSADGSQERSSAGGGTLPGSANENRRGALDACAEDLISQLALS